MRDSVVLLRTSYRFQAASGIGTLAAAVNNGDMAGIEKTLAADYTDLEVEYAAGRDRERRLREYIITGFKPMLEAKTVQEAFAAMEQFRFLCAVRRGPAGVEGINRTAEQVLRRAGLIAANTDWYQGKPIIIRRNQYEMQLFNGDTGLLWNDEQGRLKCWFRRPDNTLHPVSPARLPEHDTAYAVTIHKAQGSEFDQVLLLLPEEENRILSRELIYTGITRARSKLILCTTLEILAAAVSRRTKRHSGLAEKLWSDTL
jgi:exodeoxyribonuclease V alpha subunit